MRRILVVVVVVLILGGLVVAGRQAMAPSSLPVSSMGEDSPFFPAPSRSVRGGGSVSDEDHAAALARAIAVLGQIADGRITALPPTLDAATRAALPEAEALLAGQRPHRGAGRAYAGADGATMRIAPPLRGVGGTDDVASGAAEAAMGQTDAGTGTSLGDVRHEAERVVVSGDGVWAAMTWEPGQPPIRLREEDSAGHAICVHADDASGLRINGGMVVPGRHYRIGSGLDIQASAPIGIDIVPLDATHLVYDQPIPVPPVGPG